MFENESNFLMSCTIEERDMWLENRFFLVL